MTGGDAKEVGWFRGPKFTKRVFATQRVFEVFAGFAFKLAEIIVLAGVFMAAAIFRLKTQADFIAPVLLAFAFALYFALAIECASFGTRVLSYDTTDKPPSKLRRILVAGAALFICSSLTLMSVIAVNDFVGQLVSEKLKEDAAHLEGSNRISAPASVSSPETKQGIRNPNVPELASPPTDAKPLPSGPLRAAH